MAVWGDLLSHRLHILDGLGVSEGQTSSLTLLNQLSCMCTYMKNQ